MKEKKVCIKLYKVGVIDRISICWKIDDKIRGIDIPFEKWQKMIKILYLK